MPGYVRAMSRLPLFLLSLWTAPAFAGDVRVVTSVPVEVELNGVPVVRTEAAGEVTLRDVEPGEREFVVQRDDGQERLMVRVPAAGEVRIEVGQGGATTDSPGQAAPEDATPPVVAFRAVSGQRFAVVLGGARVGVASADTPLVIEGLAPGRHEVEIRSEDHLTIWARGSLSLMGGDHVDLSCEEGRMVRASGRDGVWKDR